MKVLITAGATQTPIDHVRAITNVFNVETGHDISCAFAQSGHQVVLLTSDAYRSEVVCSVQPLAVLNRVAIVQFRTYDDLAREMAARILGGGFDLIIHSAAVSDYTFKQAYVPSVDPHGVNELFRLFPGIVMVEPIPSQGKTSSKHDRLFLEFVPTERLVDKIRRDWGFTGTLVKFKLEVGKTDRELIDIARVSREDSDADMIVVNCLEWACECAYVIGRDDVVHAVRRDEIASAILRRMQ